MASVKNLKKDINYVLGDVIEAILGWELLNPTKDAKKSEALIDEVITVFDALILKVNQKNVENKNVHFKAITQELEDKGNDLLDKLSKL